jgi:hypothetical protein
MRIEPAAECPQVRMQLFDRIEQDFAVVGDVGTASAGACATTAPIVSDPVTVNGSWRIARGSRRTA